MFTGLIERTGVVVSVDHGSEGMVLSLEADLAGEIRPGASVAVNGVCLTAVEAGNGGFKADVMAQTLRSSSLGELAVGDKVNLERPMVLGERLDGHIVQGHVDSVGTVYAVSSDGFATVLQISPERLMLRYMVNKGSVTVNGVSLTICAIDDATFSVSLIPETQARTNLGELRRGSKVNIEVDVLAKYVEKLMSAESSHA